MHSQTWLQALKHDESTDYIKHGLNFENHDERKYSLKKGRAKHLSQLFVLDSHQHVE